MPEINFFSENIDFQLDNSESIIEWLHNSIQNESKKTGEINIIFCADTYLLELNKTYLNHDTFTDIITFNNVEKNVISGDLFISIERVKENARKLNTSFLNELSRVMIHGVLHLIGYNDKSPTDTAEIRAREDFYLALQAQ